MGISPAAGAAVDPHGEASRLRALRACGILDTPREPEFDDLASLAAQLCGARAAAVTFTDERREWCKATVGFEPVEMPRGMSLGASVIERRELVVVEDALCDPRLGDSPLVRGHPHARFYIGAPIVDHGGHVLGSICAIDTVARGASDAERQGLVRLARQVFLLIERRTLRARVSAMALERAGIEMALTTSTELASRSINAARLGWWAWAMVSDSMTWGGHFESLLGCTPGTFAGTIGALLERVEEGDRDQVDARIRLAMLGEDFEGLRFAVPRADGTKRWLEMCGGLTRALDDESPRVSGVLRDVTREVEAEIRRRREVMLKEKESRLQHAEQATLELEAFCLAAAHDLRKPLHTIANFARLLMRDDKGGLTTVGMDRLARISAASDRMAEMVEKMLQLGQHGSASLRKTHFALREAIEAVLSDLGSPQAVAVEVGTQCQVFGDVVLIREVLANLIGNALKYSRTRDLPEVRVGWEFGEREVKVWVRDNGVGFDAADAHRLFKSFERLPSALEFEGTGIGLAIVKRIVERHGGSVFAHALAGQGAEFGFVLPQG